MSKMVERVARAMLEELNIQYAVRAVCRADQLDNVVIDGTIDLLKVAEAALEAIRNPPFHVREAFNIAAKHHVDPAGEGWTDGKAIDYIVDAMLED